MHLASGPGIWAGPFASKAADDVLGPDGLTAEVITHMSSGDSSPSCFRARAIGRMHDLRINLLSISRTPSSTHCWGLD